MHKTADFYSNLLVSSCEFVTEGYQGRPGKCAHFERPLPGMVILYLLSLQILEHTVRMTAVVLYSWITVKQTTTHVEQKTILVVLSGVYSSDLLIVRVWKTLDDRPKPQILANPHETRCDCTWPWWDKFSNSEIGNRYIKWSPIWKNQLIQHRNVSTGTLRLVMSGQDLVCVTCLWPQVGASNK